MPYYGDMTEAVAGMQADSGNSYNESGRVASEVMAFGVAVALTADGKKLQPVKLKADKIMGLGILIQNELGLYSAGEAVTYKRQGRAWMRGVSGVTPVEGAVVYVDLATGKVTHDADGTNNPTITTAVFRGTKVVDFDGDKLVKVEINLL